MVLYLYYCIWYCILSLTRVLQALEVNKKLNCTTAVLIKSLKELEDIESHKDGLLYGIPVSIKENLDYEVLRRKRHFKMVKHSFHFQQHWEWGSSMAELDSLLCCFIFKNAFHQLHNKRKTTIKSTHLGYLKLNTYVWCWQSSIIIILSQYELLLSLAEQQTSYMRSQ